MHSAIENLWNGCEGIAARCGAGCPEIKELLVLMERHKAWLETNPGQHQKTVFEKYEDCAEEYICMISLCAFRDGFSLACKLLTEGLAP